MGHAFHALPCRYSDPSLPCQLSCEPRWPRLGVLRDHETRGCRRVYAGGGFLGGGGRLVEVHSHAVGRVAGAEPSNKVVDHTGPGAILAPEAQSFVLDTSIGEEKELVPEVTADALTPLLLHELGPEGGEVAARLLADPRAAGGTEQRRPVYQGIITVQRALVRVLAGHKRVLVDGLEDVGAGRQLTDAVRHVLLLGGRVGVDTGVTRQQQTILLTDGSEDATCDLPSCDPAVDKAILLELADVLGTKRFDGYEDGGVLEVAADGLEVLHGAIGADGILVIAIACAAWWVSRCVIRSKKGESKRTPKAIELGAQS